MAVALAVGAVPMPVFTVAVAQDPLEPVICEMPEAGEPYWTISTFDLSQARIPGLSYEGALGSLVFQVDGFELRPGDTVSYRAVDGMAVAGKDYVPTSGSLTFSGSYTFLVSVPIVDDARVEPDETIFLELTQPASVALYTCRMGFVILDDDPVTVSVDDVRVVESSERVTTFVRLSEAAYQPFAVQLHCVPGTALPGEDYVCDSAGGGFVVFQPGVTDQELLLGTWWDDIAEPEEAFTVVADPVISDFGGYVARWIVPRSPGTITIVDDDGPPPTAPAASPGIPQPSPQRFLFWPLPWPTPPSFTFGPFDSELSVADAAELESSGLLSFTLTLSAPLPVDLPVAFAVAPGSASGDLDYATHQGAVSIPAGSQLAEITVDTLDDALDEPDEDLLLAIAAPAVTVTRDLAQGTILDDDPEPEIVIDWPTGLEADGTLRFVVALSAASGKPVWVSYRTADGTALTPADYEAQGVDATLPCPVPPAAAAAFPCTLLFAPGETARAVDVTLVSDDTPEPPETVLVQLFDARNGTLIVAEGEGTILDEE